MSIYAGLHKAQQENKSLLCVGLDLDTKRMPSDYAGSLKQMFEFAHRIIDATSDMVCAYKPNLGFYEHHGPDGLSLLRLIVERIPDNIPVILDGKRNDIGNTAGHYARALFDTFRADWVTLNPYMGQDSLRPFLDRKDKGSFILCLTSNAGSSDFQQLDVGGKPLYMDVAEKVASWNTESNCGLVVGATHPEQLKQVRAAAGDMPILIPGVGAQGGSLEQAVLAGTDDFSKLAVINVSRSVLYASSGPDFAQRARQELEKLNNIVNKLRHDDAPSQSGAQPQEPSGGQPGEKPDEQPNEPSGEQSGPPPEIAQPPATDASGPEQEQSGDSPVSAEDPGSSDSSGTQPPAPADQGGQPTETPSLQAPADSRSDHDQHDRYDQQDQRDRSDGNPGDERQDRQHGHDRHQDRRRDHRPGDRRHNRRSDRRGDRRHNRRNDRQNDRQNDRHGDSRNQRPNDHGDSRQDSGRQDASNDQQTDQHN